MSFNHRVLIINASGDSNLALILLTSSRLLRSRSVHWKNIGFIPMTSKKCISQPSHRFLTAFFFLNHTYKTVLVQKCVPIFFTIKFKASSSFCHLSLNFNSDLNIQLLSINYKSCSASVWVFYFLSVYVCLCVCFLSNVSLKD